jgi:parallel beta-helix repeat protein
MVLVRPLSRTLLMAASLALVSNAAVAATYYVDNSGSPVCNNSTAFGSEAQPFCTIAYGVTRLAGSDELVVKQGTYSSSSLTITGPAGSASKPTVIRAYPGHEVTIRGGGNGGRVKIESTSYLTFDGFVVTNFNQGIFVEGGASHITIQNCVVHDVGQDGIHVRQNSSYITIQGCTVYNTEKIGCCNGEGFYIGTGSGGPLDNSHHITIRNNTIHDVTDEAIELKPGTHDSIVENNVIYNCADMGGQTGSAIEFERRNLVEQSWNANPNHIIRGNFIHDCYVGIRVGSGVQVYNNVIARPLSGRPGIVVTNPDDDGYIRHVYHNTIAAASDAIAVLGGQAVIRNNVGPTTAGNLAYSDALFVNAAGGDYHLVAGSPAIDAGQDVGDIVLVDKDGSPRPVGAFPDIGAYEFGVIASPPPAPTNLRIVSSP